MMVTAQRSSLASNNIDMCSFLNRNRAFVDVAQCERLKNPGEHVLRNMLSVLEDEETSFNLHLMHVLCAIIRYGCSPASLVMSLLLVQSLFSAFASSMSNLTNSVLFDGVFVDIFSLAFADSDGGIFRRTSPMKTFSGTTLLGDSLSTSIAIAAFSIAIKMASIFSVAEAYVPVQVNCKIPQSNFEILLGDAMDCRRAPETKKDPKSSLFEKLEKTVIRQLIRDHQLD
ncbi:TPA: hypothetical protein N0F65_007343 [Lagenidium giganteum]|uniref:Uncharacterized protein n=1 Tax=Lagenidium giganteum TaxID=4803 RepID=A0AAV2YJX5_9STRA|nr:TPA: hypothetical protein N0F65_007343 [Lagenidium giganteum]